MGGEQACCWGSCDLGSGNGTDLVPACPCSITGFTDHCTSYVLLAAYGNGASDIEKMPVMRGSQWSCAKLLEQVVHVP